MNTKTEEPEKKNKMEFGMQIARNCILKEINNGSQNNLVFSPLLLHIALNMVASASTGRTLKQLLSFLESENITDLNDQSSVFLELATSGRGGPIISMANGIWVHHASPLKPPFKQLAEDVYNVKAESFDFVNQGEQVRDEVNSWAREASKGHIYPLLPHDFFTKDAIALLASAIYFDGKWAKKFEAKHTDDEKFHLLNGEKVKVPFMKQFYSTQLYGSFEGFKLLKMEYKKGKSDNKRYAMYIYLPRQKDGLQELVQRFSCDPRYLLENREVSKVELEKLWLPKMKYECELNAEETMKGLGLDLPFDAKKAEITEMVETREIVYLSKVIQKSYIEVYEEGTIATAVNIWSLEAGADESDGTPPPPRPSFVADHPFLFMIKEEVSGIILFVGATLNPISEGVGKKKRKMGTWKQRTKPEKKKQKDRIRKKGKKEAFIGYS